MSTNAAVDRVFNFSAGPAVLPVPVLEQAQRDLLSLPGCGASILEISHRSKQFIANSGTDMTIGTVITAVTDMVPGKKRISAIFVPKGTPGFTISSNLEKIGLNHFDLRNLSFDDVRIPGENLIGPEGEGGRAPRGEVMVRRACVHNLSMMIKSKGGLQKWLQNQIR